MSKKQDILDAATRLFSQKGFKEAPMVEISKMTGAAEGTIFYHFKTKEELFISVLETLKQDILDEFDRFLETNTFSTGLDMVAGVVSFYGHLTGKMEDRFLLLHRHDPYQLAEVNPTCRNHLEQLYNCFVDMFERAIVRGQQDGSIATADPRKTALITYSMVDGLVRLNTYGLYDAGALHNELLRLCRRMLRANEVGGR
jgi:AcrR family transcriptional regulator